MPHGPARAARRAAACLLLGALTTVLLAWALVIVDLSVDRPYTAGGSRAWTMLHRVFDRKDSFGLTQLKWTWDPGHYEPPPPFSDHEASLPLWSILRQGSSAEPGPGSVAGVGSLERWEIGAGWPARAMVSEFDFNVAVKPERFQVMSGIALPPRHVARGYPNLQPRALPFRVARLGFAADSAFFGAIWFIALCGVDPARRALRLHRGLCPACAYSLAGNTSGICPECGQPARSV